MSKCTFRTAAVLWLLVSAISSSRAMANGWRNFPSELTCHTVDCSKPEVAVISVKRLIEAAFRVVGGMPNGAWHKMDITTRMDQCAEQIEAVQNQLIALIELPSVSRAEVVEQFSLSFQSQLVPCGWLVAALNEAGAK